MRKKLIWIGLGILAVVVRIGLGGHPELIERYYSRGFFQGIRWVIDYLLGWIPVPLIYLFITGIAALLFRSVRKIVKKEASIPRKIFHAGISFTAFTGAVVFFFLVLWGYNYGRQPIERQLALEVSPLSIAEIREELDLETRAIIELRKKIPGADHQALTAAFFPDDLERQLRRDLTGWLDRHGFPVTGRVRARLLLPRGIFLSFSSSGLYFPLTGEGHVDAGVHPLQRPYVMAHEMGHGYGFGDEGTCNFLAYLGCTGSADPFIAYAGHLGYWRTLAVNYLRYEPEKYRRLREELPRGIQADLDAINESLQKYPEIMPRLRYQAYDAYLKTQGIQEGMVNYNRVIMLAKAWRNTRRM